MELIVPILFLLVFGGASAFVWFVAAHSIATSHEQVVEQYNYVIQFMVPGEWDKTRQQLRTLVHEHLPRLVDTITAQNVSAQQDRMDGMSLVLLGYQQDSLSETHRRRIQELLHNLYTECQEQRGGWNSPPSVRFRIDDVYRLVTS